MLTEKQGFHADMIILTDKAASKVKELLQRDNKTGSALRMSVRERGCCDGFTFTNPIARSNCSCGSSFQA
jgi:Fe-S cluster assembly iron-binding protein IscA